MTEQSRVSYIDIAKAIGIYLVILGHVVNVGTPVKTLLYTFHMPLFFILSGMTYKLPSGNNWQSILNRVKKYVGSLLIPYILFALFYSKLTLPNLAFISYSSWKALKLAGSLSSLWFLMVLFISHVYLLLVYKLMQIKNGRNALLLLIIAIALFTIGVILPYGGKYGYPWMMNVAFVGSAFILAGILLRKLVSKFSDLVITWRLGILIISLIAFIIIMPVNKPSTGYVLMADGIYGNAIVFALTALLGSMIVIMISQISDVILSRQSFILWVGKNTLGIYLIHKFIISGVHTILNNWGLDNNNVAIACATSVLVLLVSCAVVVVINKFVPFILHYRINEHY